MRGMSESALYLLFALLLILVPWFITGQIDPVLSVNGVFFIIISLIQVSRGK